MAPTSEPVATRSDVDARERADGSRAALAQEPPAAATRGGRGAVSLTAGEVVGLLATVAVTCVAAASLVLAQLGRHSGWSSIVIGVAATALVAAGAFAFGGRTRVRVDLVELGLLAAVVVAGAFFFLPGFHYVWDDKDPGVYVAHGLAIAREGDVYIDDQVLERGITPAFDQAGRFPGLWVEPDHPTAVTGQFYHLYSSLLATADDVGGERALFNINPVLAIGSVCLIVLAVRRAANTLAAALTGALLVTSMMQVWQAKYPSTEIVAQLLLAGMLLAGVLAIQRRWAGGGLIVGLLAGAGFVVRPDGFLYVLFAAAAVGLALATDRFDRRSWAVLAGLGLTLPYAFWNAYEARRIYTDSNGVPGPVSLAGMIALLIVGGLALRPVVKAIARRWPWLDLGDPSALPARWHLGIGLVTSVVAVAVLALFFFREQLFGIDYQYLLFTDRVERSFDEKNMQWLSWFVTVRGLLALAAGIVVLMLGRWRAALFALVVPGALLLPIYLYDAKVSMRLMWWVRRFIPAVLPAIMILIALALCWALTRRLTVVRVLGALAAASLIVEYVHMSAPLRSHDEMAGSWDMAAAIAAHADGDQGVFLFPPGTDIYGINRNAPGIVWLVFDEVAARLPEDFEISDVQQYQEAFPDHPVFLVSPGRTLPAQLPSERFSDAGEVVGTLTFWEESRDHRPGRAVDRPMGVTVWELEPAPT
jgi:Dolichyl-phosphate-mannose-protein mannosyltransferase